MLLNASLLASRTGSTWRAAEFTSAVRPAEINSAARLYSDASDPHQLWPFRQRLASPVSPRLSLGQGGATKNAGQVVASILTTNRYCKSTSGRWRGRNHHDVCRGIWLAGTK